MIYWSRTSVVRMWTLIFNSGCRHDTTTGTVYMSFANCSFVCRHIIGTIGLKFYACASPLRPHRYWTRVLPPIRMSISLQTLSHILMECPTIIIIRTHFFIFIFCCCFTYFFLFNYLFLFFKCIIFGFVCIRKWFNRCDKISAEQCVCFGFCVYFHVHCEFSTGEWMGYFALRWIISEFSR